MGINNNQLTKKEKAWIDQLLSINFLHKNNIIDQIEHASICREYTEHFVLIHFITETGIDNIDIHTRVPLEMRVYFQSSTPMQFLMHIKNGRVYELEIFKADSTTIPADLDLDKAERIEYILAEEISPSPSS